MGTEDVLIILEKQINDFAKRIDREGITDQQELDNYFKLVHRYNRTLENSNRQNQKITSDPADEMYKRYKSMSHVEFIEDLYFGVIGKYCEKMMETEGSYPFFHEILEVPDAAWDEWADLQKKKAKKPKLVSRKK